MQFIFLNLFIDMKIEIVHSANHHQLGGAKNNNLHAPRTGHRHQQKSRNPLLLQGISTSYHTAPGRTRTGDLRITKIYFFILAFPRHAKK